MGGRPTRVVNGIMEAHVFGPESARGCYSRTGVESVDGACVEHFVVNAHAGGPWSPDLQHGGPVAALLTRSMEKLNPRPDTRITRVSVEILGAVPMTEVRVSARVERPGRRVELLAAQMEAPGPDGQFRLVALARAWRLMTQPTDDIARRTVPLMPAAADDGNDNLDNAGILKGMTETGFVKAITWRDVRPGTEPGEPTTAWMKLHEPLVEGEEISAVEQAVALADVTNGLGARINPYEFSFLNTDLTVYLHEPPQDGWLGMSAESAIGHDGVGISAAVLHSGDRPIGTVAQNLLVERR